jgi:hypothetical protein
MEQKKPGQLFEKGQEVTPIVADDGWFIVEKKENEIRLPKVGKTYTVYEYQWVGDWFISFYELGNNWYPQRNFAPVLPTSAIDELMKESLLIETV